jgi:hypothetical protein
MSPAHTPGWAPTQWRETVRADGVKTRRAIEWVCIHNRQLRVRHCGHPTANYPYYILLGGQSLYAKCGAFRSLRIAGDRALLEWEAHRGSD